MARTKPMTGRKWTEAEDESAILLYHLVREPKERIAHLNRRFKTERTLRALEHRIKGATTHQSRWWMEWKECKTSLSCRERALQTLNIRLGRELVLEHKRLWYKGEFIALASLLSGSTTYQKIQSAFQKEFGMFRSTEALTAQAEWMRNPGSPNHQIWVKYHIDDSNRPRSCLQEKTSDSLDRDATNLVPDKILDRTNGATMFSNSNLLAAALSPPEEVPDGNDSYAKANDPSPHTVESEGFARPGPPQAPAVVGATAASESPSDRNHEDASSYIHYGKIEEIHAAIRVLASTNPALLTEDMKGYILAWEAVFRA
ncbi:MAG: hypothetical protein Q9170_004339 [Blastenia crenularia]